MTLPTYRPDMPCPKCGSDDTTTYYSRNAHATGCSDMHCEVQAGLISVGRGGDCCTFEHLHRSCRRCTYAWPEAVLSP